MDAGLAAVVRQESQGAVRLLLLAERPVNALGPALRRDLMAALVAAAAAPEVRAVVIGSDLAQFSAGMDTSATAIRGAPGLAEICTCIETLGKPVIAALNGHVLGGGLELALAAHGRVAEAGARLGSPEVGLGVVPGAGGTQRLPRLVGAEAALRLLLEPVPVTAAEALALGLIDEIAEDLRAAAVVAALRQITALEGGPPRETAERRDGFRDPRAYQAAVAAARARHGLAHLPAADRAIDCVEAALLLPFQQGLAFEAQARAELAASAAARGLQHAMSAEQRAVQVPRAVAQGAAAMAVPASLAIWGGGEASADLALQALTRGLGVVLVEPGREVLVKTVERIAARQELAVGEGRMTAAARDADWARLGSVLSPSALAGADLVLTAASAPPLPVEVAAPVLPLAALPARAAPGLVALHPAAAPGLFAEFAQSDEAPPERAAAALALARALGWRLVFTGPGGPIDRRLRAALSAAMAGLEAAGLARAVIAAALASFGIGMGARAPLAGAPPRRGRCWTPALPHWPTRARGFWPRAWPGGPAMSIRWRWRRGCFRAGRAGRCSGPMAAA